MHLTPIKNRRNQAGFTLGELMATVAVMGIIFGFAVPSMQTFILNQRVRSATFELTSDLLFTRSEATKRNADVTIAATGGSWQNGWTVTAVGATVKQRDSLKDMAITASSTSITFKHTGRLPVGSAQQTFSLATSFGSRVTSRCLTVSTGGKVTNEC